MRGSAITRRTLARTCATTIALAVASAPLHARADDEASEPNESGTAAAEALFQDGRRLVQAQKYDEACPKFLASHKIAPAHGTLLNLADCYEKNGQIASAWARFREAIALAQRLGRPDREKIARDRADRLEARLVKLTIVLHDDAAEVRLDGNPIDRGALGTAVPVDPGKHTIEATAEGKKPFSIVVDITEKKRAPRVEIPVLALASGAESGSELSVVSSDPDAERPGERKEADAGASRKTVAIVVAAVGVVGVGAGAFFGLRASSKWADAKTHCDASFACDASGVSLADQASTAGTVSTLSFVAGGALVALGAVLFLTAPKSAAPPVGLRAFLGPGSILVRGAF